MMYHKSYIYYLMNINEVTQEMLDVSMLNCINSSRISNTTIGGLRYIVLKFQKNKVPIIMLQQYEDEKITYEDLILELGGSIWDDGE